MKYRVRPLLFFALLVLVSSAHFSAHALIDWSWNLTTSYYHAHNGDTVLFNAYLENSSLSTKSITKDNINSVGFGYSGRFGKFHFGPPPALRTFGEYFMIGDFMTQFQDMDLAPGERFDFVFGTFYVSPDAPHARTMPATFSFRLRGDLYDQSAIYRTAQLHVAPEPATMAIFGMGLLGFGFYRNRKHVFPAKKENG